MHAEAPRGSLHSRQYRRHRRQARRRRRQGRRRRRQGRRRRQAHRRQARRRRSQARQKCCQARSQRRCCQLRRQHSGCRSLCCARQGRHARRLAAVRCWRVVLARAAGAAYTAVDRRPLAARCPDSGRPTPTCQARRRWAAAAQLQQAAAGLHGAAARAPATALGPQALQGVCSGAAQRARGQGTPQSCPRRAGCPRGRSRQSPRARSAARGWRQSCRGQARVTKCTAVSR